MVIRNEKPRDRAVIEAAFARPEEADLVDRLREDGDREVALVAVEGCRIVGYVLFSRMRAPFRALGLAPVAVVPDRQRSGGGSGLIHAGLGACPGGRVAGRLRPG